MEKDVVYCDIEKTRVNKAERCPGEICGSCSYLPPVKTEKRRRQKAIIQKKPDFLPPLCCLLDENLPEDFEDFILTIGNQGVRLSRIFHILGKIPQISKGDLGNHPYTIRREYLYKPELQLSSKWREVLKSFHEGQHKEITNEIKTIRSVIRKIHTLKSISVTEKMKEYASEQKIPLHLINRVLRDAQSNLEELGKWIDTYVVLTKVYPKGQNAYYMHRWGIPIKALMESGKEVTEELDRKKPYNPLVDAMVVKLVDEFKSVNGYPSNQAYKNTAQLLAYEYPDLFPSRTPQDLDCLSDLVRQRYTYHTSKKKDRKKTATK